MESKLLTDIKNYIEFLQKIGYVVSISSFGNNFFPFTESLLKNEIHLHAVCTFLKSNPSTVGKCSLCKQKLQNCKIKKSTYISCYAGVEEFIFPVHYNNERIICIHVSGFRGNLKRSRRQMQKTAKICPQQFQELYGDLSETPPSNSVVKSFVAPLEYMFITLYKDCIKSTKSKITMSVADQIYIDTLQIINDNYMKDISAEFIANELGYSTSYLRAVFKKISGFSLQNKINEIRLENAKFLLCATNLNVTEIALQCGFADSNYFSVIFKKKYLTSPLLFRKESQKNSA